MSRSLTCLVLLLPAFAQAAQPLPLNNGLNRVDFTGDGKPDLVTIAHRENYNAHGFDVVTFQAPQLRDERLFSLALPRQPFSFSGKLISLEWALELIVEPGSNVARETFVLSPTGSEVVLP